MIKISKDEEIIKRNLNPHPDIIIPSQSLIDTLKQLEQLPIAKKEYEVHPMKLEESLYDAKTFLNYYYKLQDVPYSIIKKILGKEIHIVKPINPLKLPINLIENDDIFSGSVTEIITTTKFHIVFREINLSNPITEQSSSSYIHEITHTQIDHIKGALRDYYNLEILSIFNELFHASILDQQETILRLNDSRRIYEMSISAQELIEYHKGKSKTTRDELLDCCKYLISGLKAYNLFITFYYGSDKLKNDILDDIQSVFDGYLTLEELLEKYDITLENSQEPKKLIKYFNR
ncbi:MAG: hypothetical protein ACI4XM_08495 [Candidatus Coprovivens sp.]